MDAADLFIYGDLDEWHSQEQQKSKELLDVELKYNDAVKETEALRADIKALEKKIKTITVNFQNLLDTAKAEIRRKDTQIQQLRKEKDDICFRRRKPQAGGERSADDGPPPNPQNYEHAAVHANANPFKHKKYTNVPQASASPVQTSVSTATVVEMPLRVDEKSLERNGRQSFENNLAAKRSKLSPQKSTHCSDRYNENTSSRRDSRQLNAYELRFRNRRELDRNSYAVKKPAIARSSKDGSETLHKRHSQHESEHGGTQWEAPKADNKNLHRSDTKYGYEKQRSVDKNFFGHEKSGFRESSKSIGKQKDVDHEKSLKTSKSDKDTSVRNSSFVSKSDKDTSVRNSSFVSTVKDDQKYAKQVKEIERNPLRTQTTHSNDPGKHDNTISHHKTEHRFTKRVEEDERTVILALQTDKQESRLTSRPADTVKSNCNSNEKANTPLINVADENSNFATVYQMNTPKKVALFDSIFGASTNSNGSSINSHLMTNVARLLNSSGSTTTSIGDYTDVSAKNTPNTKHNDVDTSQKLNANVEIITDYFTGLQNDTPIENAAALGKACVNSVFPAFSVNAEAITDDVLVVSLEKDGKDEKKAFSTSIVDLKASQGTFVGILSENQAIKENQKAASTEELLNAPIDIVLSSEKAEPILDHNVFSPNTAVLEAPTCPPQGFTYEPVSTERYPAIQKSADDYNTAGQLKATNLECLDYSIDKQIKDTCGGNKPSPHVIHNDLLADQAIASAVQGDNESAEKPSQTNILKSQIQILENIHLPSIFVESSLAKNTKTIPKINGKTNEQNAEGNKNLLTNDKSITNDKKCVEIDVKNLIEQSNFKPIENLIRENVTIEVNLVDNSKELSNIDPETKTKSSKKIVTIPSKQVQDCVDAQNNLLDKADKKETKIILEEKTTKRKYKKKEKNECQEQLASRAKEKSNVFEENEKHATYNENPGHLEKLYDQHQLAVNEPPSTKEHLKREEKLKEIVKICQHSSLDNVTKENNLNASEEISEAIKKRKSCKVVKKSEVGSGSDNSARESTNNVRELVKKSSSNISQKTQKHLNDLSLHDKEDNEVVKIFNAQCHPLKDEAVVEMARRQCRELESSSEKSRRLISAQKNGKETKAVEDGVSFITNNIMFAEKRQEDSKTSKSTAKSKSFFKINITNVKSKSRKLSESKRPNTESKTAHNSEACKKTEDATKSPTAVDIKIHNKEKETDKKIYVLKERSEKKQTIQKYPKKPLKETVGTNNAKTIDIATDCKNSKVTTTDYENIGEKRQKLCEKKTLEATKKVSNITIKSMEKKAFVKGATQQSKVAIRNKKSWANNFTGEKSINRHRRILDSSSDDDDKPSTSKSAIARWKSRGVWIASPTSTISTLVDEKKELPTKSNLDSKCPKSNMSDGEPLKTCTHIDNERPTTQNEIRTSSTKYHNLDSIAHKSSVANLQSLHSSTSHKGEEAMTLNIVQTIIKNDDQKGNKEYASVAKTTLNSKNTASTVVVASAAKSSTKYDDERPPKSKKIDELDVVPTKPMRVRKRKLDESDRNFDAAAVDEPKKARVGNQRNDSPVADEGSDMFDAKTVDSGPLPATSAANLSQDAALGELDSRMQLIFQSPSHVGALHPSTLAEKTQPQKMLEETNITINETVNETMSLSLLEPSSILNTTTNPNVKRISLGSRDYLIEKVDDNVVKMFITRKRGKKKEKLNPTLEASNTARNDAAVTLI